MALRRRDDVAPEEFHRYWREEHGPLACRLLEPLNLRRYVQTHTLDTDLNAQLGAARGTVEAFDGVAELWWESLDDLIAAYGSEEGQHANADTGGGRGEVHRPRAVVPVPDGRASDLRRQRLEPTRAIRTVARRVRRRLLLLGAAPRSPRTCRRDAPGGLDRAGLLRRASSSLSKESTQVDEPVTWKATLRSQATGSDGSRARSPARLSSKRTPGTKERRDDRPHRDGDPGWRVLLGRAGADPEA